MNLGAVIEVGIGLILMYLLLSLLVTAINELIAQFGSIRARHLESALKRMLDLRLSTQDTENLKLFEAIRDSPTFQIAGQIAKTKGTLSAARPSYLSRETFVAALREAIPRLDNLAKVKNAAGADIDLASVKDLGTLIAALPNDSRIKSALTAAIGDVTATARDIEARVGAWFDGMMERATGAYKRWMSTLSVVLGLLLAATLNADTIGVARSLMTDSNMRQAVVELAADVVKKCGDGRLAIADKQCLDARQAYADFSHLPIGWTAMDFLGADGKPVYTPQDSIFWKVWQSILVVLHAGWVKWTGFLLTGLAVSLGAPFWFDLLSKFMTVRSSFKPADEPSTT